MTELCSGGYRKNEDLQLEGDRLWRAITYMTTEEGSYYSDVA